jgi:hypothetical protein
LTEKYNNYKIISVVIFSILLIFLSFFLWKLKF